jgi:hypothetical protein
MEWVTHSTVTPLPQHPDQVLKMGAGLFVEGDEGLVHQQHVELVGGAGHGDALLRQRTQQGQSPCALKARTSVALFG